MPVEGWHLSNAKLACAGRRPAYMLVLLTLGVMWRPYKKDRMPECLAPSPHLVWTKLPQKGQTPPAGQRPATLLLLLLPLLLLPDIL